MNGEGPGYLKINYPSKLSNWSLIDSALNPFKLLKKKREIERERGRETEREREREIDRERERKREEE